MSRVLVWLVLLLVLSFAPLARASGDADALFAEGRDLLEKGRFAEACEKLQKSEELSPAVGTLLNLGFCWEQLSRMRSAMEAYAEAEVLARANKDEKRAAFAQERFAAVEAKVMKLVIRVADASIPGLTVTRNGAPVPPTDWGNPIPVDPDDIVVVASAPGRIPWRGVVQGKGDAASITVIVPQLEEEKAPPPPKDRGLSTRQVAALALGGAALATIGAGTALALSAKSRHDDSGHHCDDTGCDETGVALQSSAVTQGNVATALVAVGLMMAGAGAYLWFFGGGSPSKPPAKGATLEIGPRGIGGHF